MRTMGWIVAALMLAGLGCGGSDGSSAPLTTSDAYDGGGYEDGKDEKDEKDKKDEKDEKDDAVICCKATGGGVFFLGDQRLTFGLNAIPDAHPEAGFGGEGISAKGHVEIQLHQTDNIFGTVDTILGCREKDGVRSATFSGELRDGGRFVVTVTDVDEPGRPDTIAFTDGLSFGPQALEQGGNLQVHDLELCEPERPKECEAPYPEVPYER